MGGLWTGVIAAGGVLASILWAIWLMISGAKESGKKAAELEALTVVDNARKVRADVETHLANPGLNARDELRKWSAGG